MNVERPWTVYRTRFVVQARQLTEPLIFTDALGREHSGQPGDYLVETSEGFCRITPRHLFEDIYVPLRPSPVALLPPGGSPQRRTAEVLAPPSPPDRVPASAWTG
jgi:hypothetical protein